MLVDNCLVAVGKKLGDAPAPVYLHEITVNRRRLRKGMLAWLKPATNRSAGQYRFEYAERLKDGSLLLHFYGRVNLQNQRYVTARPNAVRQVCVRSEAIEDKEEV